jgi:hypothetical protein
MVENIGSRLAASADEYLGYLEGWLENLPEHEHRLGFRQPFFVAGGHVALFFLCKGQ